MLGESTMSLRKLPHLAITLALLASCTPPTTPTGAISGSIASNNAEALKGATIRVLDRNNTQVATGKTTPNGQYLVSGIPAGDMTVIVNTAQNSEQANVTIYPGRVSEVPRMELTKAASNVAPQAVTGKVLDANGSPVSGAVVTDLTGGTANAQATTNGQGEFALSLTGLDKPRSLEIVKDNLVTTTTVTQDKLTNVTVTLIPNARSLTGVIKDAVFSDNTLGGVTVKVNGTSISTTSNTDGSFTLRGVPFDRVTLEASGRDGYSPATQVQDGGRDNVSDVTLKMTPFGNLVVHVQPENAPITEGITWRENVTNFPTSFKYFDKNGDGRGSDPTDPTNFDPGEWEYDNYKALLGSPHAATIQIKGTTVTDNFEIAVANKRSVLSRAGTVMGEVYDRNFFITRVLRGVPGGRQDVSVSLAGHNIQKSLSVVIQPLETVSTDLVVLKRVDSNTTVGDIVGKVLGIRAEDMSKVRIGYIPIDHVIDMTLTAFDPKRPHVLTLAEALDGTNRITPPLPAGVTPDSSGRYRLFNVPTGSRLVVGGVSDGSGGYNSVYIPNTVSLLNVVAGLSNQAPDLNLQIR
jgi:hypothetical protein